MEITNGMLLNLAIEDFHVRAQWLNVWTAMAKEELETHETPWEPIYGLLFWAQVEARRRREFLVSLAPEIMGNEVPDTEIEAMKMLRAIEDRWKSKDGGANAKKKWKPRVP